MESQPQNPEFRFKSEFSPMLMRTLANSEDPDEMMRNGAFHQGLNCMLTFYLEIITCDPSIYTMDHPKFIVSNQVEESISL